MAPRALPVSGISECIACASAAEGGGSLLLASSSNAATFAARIEESAPLLSKLLHVPTLWSVLAMSSIVTLLVAWEEAVENVIHNTPKQIKPVIDSMLAEVGGLGFIGLFLSVVVTGGPLGNFIGDISEEFLGDEELLLETFEFLHTFFFEVGILFFVIAGLVVGAVLKEVSELSKISELALDADGDGEVTLDELADGLDVESMIIDLNGDGVIDEYEIAEALKVVASRQGSAVSSELSMTDTDRAGECLVIRERMIEQRGLPESFQIEDYFAEIFGQELKKKVELSPVTWIPLIPLIAIANSVDLTRDVVSAASSNAFDSCGFFYATPWVLYSAVMLQVISVTWSTYNFWKMATVKRMLLPTLVKGSLPDEAMLLPPMYEDNELKAKFDSSPSIFASIERFFSEGGADTHPPRNKHEELFGAVGSQFKQVFGDSIQFHTWMSVALITYSTTQILLRDASALYSGTTSGNVDSIVPEMAVWGLFTASNIFQLSLAPTTFLNYCFVIGVEEYTKNSLLEKLAFEAECVVAKPPVLSNVAQVVEGGEVLAAVKEATEEKEVVETN